jgi:hypothetical protein
MLRTLHILLFLLPSPNARCLCRRPHDLRVGKTMATAETLRELSVGKTMATGISRERAAEVAQGRIAATSDLKRQDDR